MKYNLDIKILEILERETISVRLRNGLLRAESEGNLPFENLSEYVDKKNDLIEGIIRIPNIGLKSVNELIEVLDKYALDCLPVDIKDYPFNKQHLSLSIPDVCKNLNLIDFVRENDCSNRLKNNIISSVGNGELGFTVLGDLDGKTLNFLRNALGKVSNLGFKSSEEFIRILVDFLDKLQDTEVPVDGAGYGFNSRKEYGNVKSNFVFLLENSGFSNLTVMDIIERTPSSRKQHKTLIDSISSNYIDSTVCDLLKSTESDINELSKILARTDRLVPLLVDVLRDFYKFLLEDDKENHLRKYFLNEFYGLDNKESDIILDRLGGEKFTLEELGQRYGVTRERIRQIESVAVRKYIDSNRIGLYCLLRSIERYVNASKGVLPVHVIKRLCSTSIKNLEVALSFITTTGDSKLLIRDGGYIITKKFLGFKKQIFSAVEEVIYQEGGCNSKILIARVNNLNRITLEYFLYKKHKKFKLNDLGDIEIIVRSASERARIVLAAAGRPIHTAEAVRYYKSIFKEEITEHTLGSTFNRLKDALIVGPGTFTLYSNLQLDSDSIEQIRDEVYEFLCIKGEYLSSRVIFDYIRKIKPEIIRKEPKFNYYMMHGILQDDSRYRIGRGFMVGLPTHDDYLPLEAEIGALVHNHGPISISEIIGLLRPTRGIITNGSVRNTLIASEDIYMTAERKKWDEVYRVFKDRADIRRLQIAIRIATYKESIALSSLYNRIRSTGFEYAIGTILSLIWKDPEITLDGDYVCFDGTDVEVENYYLSGEPVILRQLDYRNYSEEKSIDTSVLDTLIQEFDSYV